MTASIAVLLLVYLVGQRLTELVIARRNTARLLAAGGVEHAATHYPLIVALHSAWLLALAGQVFFTLYAGEPVGGAEGISLPLLAVFVAVQGLRFWTLATLGPRWTTRIIVVPDETLVAQGPFRFVSHPNYLVVIAEIALVPLILGLPVTAAIFSALNAAMLVVRVSAEERALAPARAHSRTTHPAASEAR